jgi:2-hydroxychromene-2-carboxylate isomerase
LSKLGKDPEVTIKQANTREIRDRYASETQVARALGIFGSPTFVSGSEIFWGDDRLEDAIDWSRSRPLAA